MTTRLKKLLHRTSMRRASDDAPPNRTRFGTLHGSTGSSASADSFSKVAQLKKQLPGSGSYGLICSLTNRLDQPSLLLCWHQTTARPLDDDRTQRMIKPNDISAFASVAVDPTLGNCSARVYQVVMDNGNTPAPGTTSTLSESALQDIAEDADVHGLGRLSKEEGRSGTVSRDSSLQRRNGYQRYELFLLLHWALEPCNQPCYTAEWAVAPYGSAMSDWLIWQTFADQLLLDCCPQGTTAMRRTPVGVLQARQSVALAAYMSPESDAPVLVLDIKPYKPPGGGNIAVQSMLMMPTATRQTIYDSIHTDLPRVLPTVTVVLVNRMSGVTLQHGRTMAMRCACPAADAWPTTVANGSGITAIYSPQEDTQSAAALLTYALDQPCGPWLKDRPEIAILWRIRGGTVHAYMMAAECGRWESLVLDTHLEISMPAPSNAATGTGPTAATALRSDARQTSQRIPLDDSAQSQVSLELSWHDDEGIRLEIVMTHNSRPPSRTPSGTSDGPPRSPGILSRTSSVRYRHGRMLTRINGTIIRTAVPRDSVVPTLFTVRLEQLHPDLTLQSGYCVALDGSSVSPPTQLLEHGQDTAGLFSLSIHSGTSAGFAIYALCRPAVGRPLPRHPCLILAWRVSPSAVPCLLAHTMYITPEQVNALSSNSGMAQRFYTGLESAFVETCSLQRHVQLEGDAEDDGEFVSIAVSVLREDGLHDAGNREVVMPTGLVLTLSAEMPSYEEPVDAEQEAAPSENDEEAYARVVAATTAASSNATAQLGSHGITPRTSAEHCKASTASAEHDGEQPGPENAALPTPSTTPAAGIAAHSPSSTSASRQLLADKENEAKEERTCTSLSLPSAAVQGTQLTLMVANRLVGARLQFFAAYPLDVGSGLSHPIIDAGEQTIMLLQEHIAEPLSKEELAPGEELATAFLSGCMVFMVELPDKRVQSLYLLVGWHVATAHTLATEVQNSMQVFLFESPDGQSLPIEDAEWESLLLQLSETSRPAGNTHTLYYNIASVPLKLETGMTNGSVASLSVQLRALDMAVEQPEQVLVPRPLEAHLTATELDALSNDDSEPSSATVTVVESITPEPSLAAAPRPSLTAGDLTSGDHMSLCIDNQHPSLRLQPLPLLLITGEQSSASAASVQRSTPGNEEGEKEEERENSIGPGSRMTLNGLRAAPNNTNGVITEQCSGLWLAAIYEEDAYGNRRPLPGQPHLVAGWTINPLTQERHFFSRVTDNPFAAAIEDAAGGVSLVALLTGRPALRRELMQRLARGRFYEAGRRVTTRCVLAGDTSTHQPRHLAVGVYMPATDELPYRLEVSFQPDTP